VQKKQWALAGETIKGRGSYTATLLPNGHVLLLGGVYSTSKETLAAAGGIDQNIASTIPPEDQAVLFDPIACSWSSAGVPIKERVDHTATLLPNGKILVAGGRAAAAQTSEIFDSALVEHGGR
jgi:hypothetical protein